MSNATDKFVDGMDTVRESQDRPASDVTGETASNRELARLPATTFEGLSSPTPPRLKPKRSLSVELPKGVPITITQPSSPESIDLGLFERSTTQDIDGKTSRETRPSENDLAGQA
jgi:hypothetical protein